MNIGWCLVAPEAGACYDPPEKFIPLKDSSPLSRGFLSCPAISSYFNSTFSIASPFSLQLTAKLIEGEWVVQPVFPFTSLTNQKVQELVKIEPASSWRDKCSVVVQIPSPYVFFADEPILIKQESPILVTPSSYSWRLIPGKFNIFDWQRPLNWAFEWNPNAGDFIIRTGECMYFISFEYTNGSKVEGIDLLECDLSPELSKAIQMTRGVTSLRRGTTSLMNKTGQKRTNKFFNK